MQSDPAQTAKQHASLRTPAAIVLLYVGFFAVWIAGSDRLLSLLLQDAAQFERAGTARLSMR